MLGRLNGWNSTVSYSGKLIKCKQQNHAKMLNDSGYKYEISKEDKKKHFFFFLTLLIMGNAKLQYTCYFNVLQ